MAQFLTATNVDPEPWAAVAASLARCPTAAPVTPVVVTGVAHAAKSELASYLVTGELGGCAVAHHHEQSPPSSRAAGGADDDDDEAPSPSTLSSTHGPADHAVHASPAKPLKRNKHLLQPSTTSPAVAAVEAQWGALAATHGLPPPPHPLAVSLPLPRTHAAIEISSPLRSPNNPTDADPPFAATSDESPSRVRLSGAIQYDSANNTAPTIAVFDVARGVGYDAPGTHANACLPALCPGSPVVVWCAGLAPRVPRHHLDVQHAPQLQYPHHPQSSSSTHGPVQSSALGCANSHLEAEGEIDVEFDDDIDDGGSQPRGGHASLFDGPDSVFGSFTHDDDDTAPAVPPIRVPGFLVSHSVVTFLAECVLRPLAELLESRRLVRTTMAVPCPNSRSSRKDSTAAGSQASTRDHPLLGRVSFTRSSPALSASAAAGIAADRREPVKSVLPHDSGIAGLVLVVEAAQGTSVADTHTMMRQGLEVLSDALCPCGVLTRTHTHGEPAPASNTFESAVATLGIAKEDITAWRGMFRDASAAATLVAAALTHYRTDDRSRIAGSSSAAARNGPTAAADATEPRLTITVLPHCVRPQGGLRSPSLQQTVTQHAHTHHSSSSTDQETVTSSLCQCAADVLTSAYAVHTAQVVGCPRDVIEQRQRALASQRLSSPSSSLYHESRSTGYGSPAAPDNDRNDAMSETGGASSSSSFAAFVAAQYKALPPLSALFPFPSLFTSDRRPHAAVAHGASPDPTPTDVAFGALSSSAIAEARAAMSVMTVTPATLQHDHGVVVALQRHLAPIRAMEKLRELLFAIHIDVDDDDHHALAHGASDDLSTKDASQTDLQDHDDEGEGGAGENQPLVHRRSSRSKRRAHDRDAQLQREYVMAVSKVKDLCFTVECYGGDTVAMRKASSEFDVAATAAAEQHKATAFAAHKVKRRRELTALLQKHLQAALAAMERLQALRHMPINQPIDNDAPDADEQERDEHSSSHYGTVAPAEVGRQRNQQEEHRNAGLTPGDDTPQPQLRGGGDHEDTAGETPGDFCSPSPRKPALNAGSSEQVDPQPGEDPAAEEEERTTDGLDAAAVSEQNNEECSDAVVPHALHTQALSDLPLSALSDAPLSPVSPVSADTDDDGSDDEKDHGAGNSAGNGDELRQQSESGGADGISRHEQDHVDPTEEVKSGEGSSDQEAHNQEAPPARHADGWDDDF